LIVFFWDVPWFYFILTSYNSIFIC